MYLKVFYERTELNFKKYYRVELWSEHPGGADRLIKTRILSDDDLRSMADVEL